MRKAQVVVGEHYVTAIGSRIQGNVRVVENEEYYELSVSNIVGQRELRQDPKYVAAHLAWVLNTAPEFARNTTPFNRDSAIRGLREATSTAQYAYIEANPLKAFRKGKSSYSKTGILCRRVNNDQPEFTDGHYLLVPRRELYMTWADYLVKVEEDKVSRERAAVAKAEYQKVQATQKQAVSEVMAKLGYTLEHGTSYKKEVDGQLEEYFSSTYSYGSSKLLLSDEQLLHLLNDAITYGRESEKDRERVTA